MNVHISQALLYSSESNSTCGPCAHRRTAGTASSPFLFLLATCSPTFEETAKNIDQIVVDIQISSH